MIFKQGGNLGVGVDTGKSPEITYDGKWSGWYVETYGGKAYWEAVVYTSGVLTVTGEYIADAWGLGGGGYPYYVGSGIEPFGGRGSSSIVAGVVISGDVAVSIGAGSRGHESNYAGGSTMLGDVIVGAGGVANANGGGYKYRFGDPDKAGEAGADATTNWYQGEGGWLHWNGSYYGYSGCGYGAGGGSGNSSGYSRGHEGALVLRISVE